MSTYQNVSQDLNLLRTIIILHVTTVFHKTPIVSPRNAMQREEYRLMLRQVRPFVAFMLTEQNKSADRHLLHRSSICLSLASRQNSDSSIMPKH